MCGRLFFLFDNKNELIEIVSNDLNTELDSKNLQYSAPKYNISPTSFLPVLTEINRIESLHWGFKILGISQIVINARNEEVESKKSFKDLIDHARCVVVCSGYYEWHTGRANKKSPYSFQPKDKKVCYLAALKHKKTNSVVLMTREAVPSIAHIHTRMPVILRNDFVSKWLDNQNIQFENLRELIIENESYTGKRENSKDFIEIEHTALANHVNNVKSTGPECLQSLKDYKEKSFSKGIAFDGNRVQASHSKLAQVIPPPSSAKPECSFPRLKHRLQRMINYNEPEAFGVILHSECRGHFDPSSIHHCQLFDNLLTLSSTRDVTPFLNYIMRDESYSPLMIQTWSIHRPLVSLPVLLVLKSHFKHPDSSLIFPVSIEYPAGSPERVLLNEWLVELQKPLLNWPFSSNHAKEAARPSSPSARKSKSSSIGKEISWSEEFENVPGITESESELQTAAEPVPQVSWKSLRFGHIYGWVSRKLHPMICNGQERFYLCGHAVKLHDTFLSFASPNFPLNEYAKSAKKFHSFFDIGNHALRLKVKQSPEKRNFAACRLKGTELQAMLKGDLMLVVLGQRESGEYDFKYPTHPYEYFKNEPVGFQSFSLKVAPRNIVLILHRSLFVNEENSINAHDIPGAFHHTELSTFDGTFVNFVNYVYFKTQHRGFIAVGGFIHENLTI